jgi:RNA polymerase sigma factor (sigma-70 family)
MTDARRLLALLGPPESDADLLDRFLAGRDAEAFAHLVRRHGPMVFAVCLRVLRHRQDAEDAFQATFLVLARKAGSVRPRSLLANWLHGVAHRTALEARRASAVRRQREHAAAAARAPAAAPEVPDPDVREVLDRELAALPEVYRAAVVACDLEGLGRREAARRLGFPRAGPFAIMQRVPTPAVVRYTRPEV